MLFVQVFFIYACSSNEENNKTISILRIGVLPDENKEKLLQRYTPLCEYISKQIGVPYDLVIPKSYSDLSDLFHEQKVDLVYFGGYTFVKAHTLDAAVPLVMRDVDISSTSYFLAKTDSPLQKLADFKGMKFSFGSWISTSGHLMPRYFLKEMELVPENFFCEVSYSGKHELTAEWVAEGRVDLGVANQMVIETMYKDGRLNINDVRIIWQTPPYPDYVWALSPSIKKNMQIKIRDAFLSLSKTNSFHSEILAGVGATSFLPCGINEFTKLKMVIDELSL